VILAGASLIERIMISFHARDVIVTDQEMVPGMRIDLLQVLRNLIVENCEKCT